MSAEIEVPVFGEAETITVADLAVGDFVVGFPAQGRFRGRLKNSGVEAVEDRWDRWATQYRRRGPKFPIPSRIVRFLDRDLIPLDVPSDCKIIVRRPIGGQEGR